MDLVGRADELADLLDRLRGHRLVTVTGPGGVGKTALARAAVGQAAGEYALGSRAVDLTLVEAAEAVGGALAAQLGFPSFAGLIGGPAEQPALLLIDNCEHLLDAAADAIAQLLDSCQSPTVVATSRSPLDLPGESVLVLAPLAVPPAGSVDEEAAAVQLFRGRAHDAGADLGDDHLEAVTGLVRALDGLPLAIELAAARARTMTPAEMLAKLDLDTLTRPRFRGSRRHRGLRDTIEWSYRLLDEPDRRMLDRLGVLAGPFTLDTAHAVGAEPDVPPADSLERIDTLVAASLLVAEPRDGVMHYRQLDVVRTYARERLGVTGEWETTWERFVDHVLESARAISSMYGGQRWDAARLAELLAMYDHLLAALRWCVEHDSRPTRAFQLQTMLWSVLFQAHLEDVAALSEQTLARWPEPTEPSWADAAAIVVACRYLLGSPAQAVALAEFALEHVEGSVLAPCILHRIIGQARDALGDQTGALEQYGAAVAEAQARGFDSFALHVSLLSAAVQADLGDMDEALRIVDGVQSEAAASGLDFIEVWARTVRGHVMLRLDIESAVPIITDALDRVRQMDNPACRTANQHSMALVNVANGDLSAAARLAVDVLDDMVARGAVAGFRPALRTAAVVLQRSDRPAWADLAATTAAMPRVGILSVPGRELFALPDASGQALTQTEAIRLARRELRAVADGEASMKTGPQTTAAPAPATEDEGVFVRVGEFWEVGFAARTVNLKSSKGMEDLARLLAAPDRDISCTELVGAVSEQASTGEVIDQTARRQYEQRLRDLQAEIDDAEAANDIARAERAQREFDTLLDHLSTALGLGGKARRPGGTTERARSTVTQRVRSTIRRIAAAHPELGRHLRTAIVTGTYCSYRPERPIRWRT